MTTDKKMSDDGNTFDRYFALYESRETQKNSLTDQAFLDRHFKSIAVD